MNRMKELREEKKKTQQELSAYGKVSNLYSHWENSL